VKGVDTEIVLRIFAAGTALRFEPGQTRDVQRMALAAKKAIYGFRGDVMGKL
jgi:urease subunit beta